MNFYTLQTAFVPLARRTKGQRNPDNRDFLHEYAKNPQTQQAARV
jgi:hypothetical protein